MKKIKSFVSIIGITVLIIMNSCEQENLSIQKESVASCDGCRHVLISLAR